MGNSDHGTTCMRVGGDDGELRPLHYIYLYSIDSRLTHNTPPYPPRACVPAPCGYRGTSLFSWDSQNSGM